MTYYKQSFDEAQGNALSMDAYRDRKAELKAKHGELIFTIQAKYEKRRRQLQGQLHKLNDEFMAEIQAEMAHYKEQKTELAKLIQQ